MTDGEARSTKTVETREFIHRPVLIEREAERMAIACDFGVTEWEAFVGLAERKLIADGVIGAVT